jgi:hypothetical protein
MVKGEDRQMMCFYRLFVGLLSLLICWCACLAQSPPAQEPSSEKVPQGPYIRKSVGIEKPKVDVPTENSLSAVPIDLWVGQRFIFLPRQKSLQEYGYQGIHKPKKEYGTLPYSSYVGRIVKVTAVSKARYGISGAYKVELTLEDTNEKVEADSSLGNVEGLALVRDIDHARTMYLGKTLWLKDSMLRTYNEETGKGNVIAAKRYSRVKVTDIVAGWDEASPVRFVVQMPSGDEGFIDASMSDTNASATLTAYNKFEKLFLIEDPRITYPWSNIIWAAIDEHNVLIGMTRQQVVVSWGEPQVINTTRGVEGESEQWVYSSHRYLYFSKGVLTSIQE